MSPNRAYLYVVYIYESKYMKKLRREQSSQAGSWRYMRCKISRAGCWSVSSPSPIPNAKFPPITALLNRPTYHKPRAHHHPVPKSHGNANSMNKLTSQQKGIPFRRCFFSNSFWRTRGNFFWGKGSTSTLAFWWHLPWVSKPGWISSLACFLSCIRCTSQRNT